MSRCVAIPHARLRSFAVVIGMLTLFAVSPASASAAVKDIASDGPLTHIFAGDSLSCQIAHSGDSGFQFYHPGVQEGSCGTFVWAGETTYGFGSYTQVSQSEVLGTGTSADPLRVITVVGLGDTGLELTQTDSYIVGDEAYRTRVEIANSTSSAVDAVIYHGADCYLQSSDSGYGFADAASGGIYCSLTPNNSPPDRIEGFAPVTPGSHYFQGFWLDVFSLMNGNPYPDTCTCDTFQDNGTGLSWNVTVPANGSVSVTLLSGFSPTGTVVPPAGSPTATDPASPANNNTPNVRGDADTDSTISLYTDSACTSAVAGTGTGAEFASPGIPVSVADDTTTTFYATATVEGATGPCSTGSVTYVEDSTAPVVTVTDPVDGSVSSDPTPELKGVGGAAAGDDATVTVELYEGNGTGGTLAQTKTATRDDTSGAYSVDADSLPDGTYTARSEQADAALNTGTSATSTFTVDTAAPTVTLVSPADGSSTADATPAVSGTGGTADGDDDTVTIKFYEGTGTAGTLLDAKSVARDDTTGAYALDADSLPDGTYTAQAEQSDAAGNPGTSSANTFTVDITDPTTGDDVPDSFQSAAVEVTLTASDTGGTGVDKTYYTTGANPAEPTPSSSEYDDADKPVLQDGERIRYFSTDNAGNSEAPHSSPAAKVDSDGDGIGDATDDVPGQAPTAVDDSRTLAEDSGATSLDVLANDTDPDGGSTTITSVVQPSHGSVVVAGDGATLSYRPDARYCNSQAGGVTDSFSYTLNGGSSATVTVSVTCGPGEVASVPPARCAGVEATIVASGPGDLTGTAGRDVIVGSSGADRIDGGDGDDVICAGAGNDRITGGAGNDRLFGQAGSDVLSGWTGRDRLSGGSGADRLLGRSGDDRIAGDAGNDRAHGGSGNDRVSGNEGNDSISGDSGNDNVTGGSGRDRIYGRAGRDRLVASDSSRDRLNCGSGRDSASMDRRDAARRCE